MKICFLLYLFYLFKMYSFSSNSCNKIVTLLYHDAKELILYNSSNDFYSFILANSRARLTYSNIKDSCLLNDNNKCFSYYNDLNTQTSLFDLYLKTKKTTNIKEQMLVIYKVGKRIVQECKPFTNNLLFPDIKKCLEDIKKYQKDLAELQKAVNEDNQAEIDRLLPIVHDDGVRVQADCT